MSAEPIDIEVKDRISPAVRDKLLNIAQAALEAANSVDTLIKQLARIDGNSVAKLTAAQKALGNQTAKNNALYLAQETALNKAVAAESKALAASAKLQQQQAKTSVTVDKSLVNAERLAQAQAKTADANTKAALSSEKLAAAQTKTVSAQATAAAQAERSALAQVAAQQKLAAATSLAVSAQAKVATANAQAAAAQTRLTTAQQQSAAASTKAGAATAAAASQAAIATQRLASAQAVAAAAQTRAGTASTAAATAAQRLAVATAQAEAAQSRAAAAALRLQQAQERAASGNNFFTNGLRSFAIQALSVAAAYRLVLDVISKADAYTNLQNKLTQVATSQQQVNTLTLELLDVANRSRAPLDAVGTTYTRISQALKAVGGSSAEALKITEALTKSTAAAGLTATEQASALLQVSQAFNKGKLDGDEFRSVMENFPQFGDAIAKSLGLANKGLLFDAAKQGKITLDVMRDAMLALGDAADQNLARSTVTVDQAFTRLQNSSTVLIGELNKTLGITNLLTKGLNFLATAAENAAKANTQLGTAQRFEQDNASLIRIQNEIEGLQEKIKLGQAGLAGQIKLNNLLKIQESIQANIRANAQASRSTLRQSENAADANVEAAKQGALASAVNDVYEQMDKVKVGTHKADVEIAKFRKSLEALRLVSLTDPKAEALYQDALSKQKQVEDAIRKKNTVKSPVDVGAKEDYKRAISLGKINDELEKQLDTFGMLAEARVVEQRLQQIDIDLATQNLKALTAPEREKLKLQSEQVESNKKVQASQDALYSEVTGPQEKYQTGLKAITNLVKIGAFTQDQAKDAIDRSSAAYEDATQPINAYIRSFEQQNKLLDVNANQREILSAQFALENANRTALVKLTETEIRTITQNNIALQKRNEFMQAYDAIVAANTGSQQQLVTQLNALNSAYALGVISQDQYAQGFVQIGLAMNQLLLDKGAGFATFENVAMGAIGRIVEGYKNALASLSETFGSFFTTLTDGFANSIGRAIVYGDNLKESLLNVARQGVAELISGLVKLGIQYVINAALGKTIAASALVATTASSVAAAATIASAWAPAAAAVSLASYGANALPANAGIASSYALTKALSAIGSFQVGGYTGDVPQGQIAGAVHGQEFVMNAAATRANRGTLEAMNSGQSVGTGFKLSVANYGTPQDYQAEQIGPNEIRLIATDAARNVVSKEAPGIIASDMANPNSKTSKALSAHTNTSRKR